MARRIRLNKHSEPRLSEPKTAFAKRLHKYLKAMEVGTIEEASKVLGFSRHSILLWRRGDRIPAPNTKRLLESYFKFETYPPGW
jgi:hypothetical protein